MPQKYQAHLNRRALLRLLILGFLMYAVIAGFSGLQHSLAALRTASLGYVLLAGGAVVVSYGFAALTYTLLSSRNIRYIPTLLIQISGGLVNRLLPAGLGGLGINMLYLKKHGYSIAAASAVVATNNIVGLIGNLLLLLGVGVFFSISLPELTVPTVPLTLLIAATATLAILAVYIARSRSATRKVQASFREMATFFVGLIHRPIQSLAALLSSCALTAAHALAMYFVFVSVHIDLPWPVALIAISASAFAGAVVPTPGGLGGAEAGIVATLVVFSMPSAAAVAVALIYRGLTYWIPLLPGYVALRVAERSYL